MHAVAKTTWWIPDAGPIATVVRNARRLVGVTVGLCLQATLGR